MIQIAPNFLGSLLVGASFEAGRHGDSAAPHPANLRSVAKDGDGQRWENSPVVNGINRDLMGCSMGFSAIEW